MKCEYQVMLGASDYNSFEYEFEAKIGEILTFIQKDHNQTYVIVKGDDGSLLELPLDRVKVI